MKPSVNGAYTGGHSHEPVMAAMSTTIYPEDIRRVLMDIEDIKQSPTFEKSSGKVEKDVLKYFDQLHRDNRFGVCMVDNVLVLPIPAFTLLRKLALHTSQNKLLSPKTMKQRLKAFERLEVSPESGDIKTIAQFAQKPAHSYKAKHGSIEVIGLSWSTRKYVDILRQLYGVMDELGMK